MKKTNTKSSKVMKSDKNVKTVQKHHVKGKDGGSKNAPTSTLTAKQAEHFTSEAVALLNEQTTAEAKTWIDRGRIVADFIAKFKPDGDTYDKYFQMLAAHPACVLKKQQIRYYFSCFKLWERFQVNLPITHFIAVLPKKVNFAAKGKLLLEAERETLTASALKDKVSDHIEENRKQDANPKPFNWEKAKSTFTSRSEAALATFSKLNRMDGDKDPMPDDVRKSIASTLLNIVRFGLTHHYITAKDLSQMEKLGTNPTTIGNQNNHSNHANYPKKAA